MSLVRLDTRVLLITTILLTIGVNSHSFEPFNEALTNYTKQFKVEEEIEIMKNYMVNITFNSTREKYMFIFYPLMGKCVDEIQEEYEAIFSSFEHGGIGGATYGFVIGSKIAIKAGLWKFGLASFLKAAAASTLSMGALPFVAGVGVASYFYQNYQQEEMKENCRSAMQEIENLILKIELKELELIKESLYNSLKEKEKILNYIIKFMQEFPEIYKNYTVSLKKFNAKEKMLGNYLKNFSKIIQKNIGYF